MLDLHFVAAAVRSSQDLWRNETQAKCCNEVGHCDGGGIAGKVHGLGQRSIEVVLFPLFVVLG